MAARRGAAARLPGGDTTPDARALPAVGAGDTERAAGRPGARLRARRRSQLPVARDRAGDAHRPSGSERARGDAPAEREHRSLRQPRATGEKKCIAHVPSSAQAVHPPRAASRPMLLGSRSISSCRGRRRPALTPASSAVANCHNALLEDRFPGHLYQPDAPLRLGAGIHHPGSGHLRAASDASTGPDRDNTHGLDEGSADPSHDRPVQTEPLIGSWPVPAGVLGYPSAHRRGRPTMPVPFPSRSGTLPR